jgi:LysR family glycine cleavage system transcriptional activator
MVLPDLESLRCFEAAAVHLNFRVAAAHVALSPAAFSDRIRRLEETLDAVLFERTTRRVVLTPAGRRLLPQARRCIEEARRCRDVVRDDGRRAPFELTVGTRHELGMSWLLPALDGLGDARPERTLHLYFGNEDLLPAVERGTIDALVSSVRLSRPGLAYANLHEERYVFVAAPALVTAGFRGAEDARELVLIDVAPQLSLFRYLLDALDRPEMWSFRATEVVGAIAAVKARVVAGIGVAVLPLYFARPELADGRLVALLPEVEPRVDWFRLIWRAGDPREEELQALAEELRALPLQ